jgi:hypothetical protein
MKAFPQASKGMFGEENTEYGMDLRDYFAAKAMEAFLTDLTHKQDVFLLDEVADTAYAMADAMMKARNK